MRYRTNMHFKVVYVVNVAFISITYIILYIFLLYHANWLLTKSLNLCKNNKCIHLILYTEIYVFFWSHAIAKKVSSHLSWPRGKLLVNNFE